MSVFGLTVEFVVGGGDGKQGDLRSLSVAFERAGEGLRQFGKYAWPGLIREMEVAEEEQFEGEGVGPSGKWAQLSVQYQEWKEKRFPDTNILERTGALREALTQSSAGGALRAESDAELVFGTQGIPYASYPQTGTRRMPVRAPIDFGPEFEESAQRAVADGIRQAMREGGLEADKGSDE